MVGGVISDIYHTQDRNTPMALFAGAALFGTGLAPLLAGAIVSHTSWRWVYYSHAIVSAVFVVVIFLFFKETRGSVLLSRKAKALNGYYESLEASGHYGVIMANGEPNEEKTKRIRWKVKADEQRESLGKMIQISLWRPFRESFPRKTSGLLLTTRFTQTCSSPSQWSSSSPSGYLSAGQFSTSSSRPFLSCSKPTTVLISSRLEPCSHVCQTPS